MAEGDSSAPSRESSPPHRLSISEPKDMGLPRTKRSYAVPAFMALAVFALIILVRLAWD